MEENQQMIADEQYYYGCDNLPHVASLPEHAIPTPIEPDVNQFEIIQRKEKEQIPLKRSVTYAYMIRNTQSRECKMVSSRRRAFIRCYCKKKKKKCRK